MSSNVGDNADGSAVQMTEDMRVTTTTGRTKLESGRGHLEWDIENMDVLLPNEAEMGLGQPEKDEYFSTFKTLRSPTFKTYLGRTESTRSEQKWFLELGVGNHKANTYSTTEDRFVSLFLHYKKEPESTAKSSTFELSRLLVSFCIMGLEEKEFHKRIFQPPIASIQTNGRGYANFVCLKSLWDNRKTQLVNNILRVRAEVEVFGSPIMETTNSGYLKSASSIAANKWADDMRQLFKSGKDSDVTVNCGGKAFLVHAAILKGRNLVFERMLESGMKESVNRIIKIDDMDPIVLETFLEFIYTAQVELRKESMDKIFDLVRVADRYGVEELKDICLKFMHENVTLSNAGEIAALSYQHNAEDYLRAKIVNFCQSNWSELVKLPTFKERVNECPLAFFEKSRKKIKLDLEVDREKKD